MPITQRPLSKKLARALSKNPHLLNTFQILVKNKLRQWELEREIERTLNRTLDRMDDALSDFCVSADADKPVRPKDLEEYLLQLYDATEAIRRKANRR